jgi:small-conductance mechanosensitive channel
MEEIEKSVSPLLFQAQEIWYFVIDVILSGLSLPQIIAIGVSLIVALLFHRWVRRLIMGVETRLEGGRWRRLFHTARMISLPIAWVIGLWVSLIVLNATGHVTGLVRLVASLLNAWVVIRIVATAIPNAGLSNAFAWFAWAVAALNATAQLDPLIRWMHAQKFSTDILSISIWDVVQGAIVTAMCVWLAVVVSGFLQHKLERSGALNPSMRVLTSKIIRIVLIAFAIGFGVRAVGVDLRAFAVFSGALGIGVGLGLQRTVGNLVAGFTMLADRSIKPGDVIEITTGDGPTFGEVRTLGARYVSVKTRAGTLIPNEILISSPVTNWSFSDRYVRRDLMIGVAYSTDVEVAQTLCIAAARKAKRVLQTPAPACLIKGFGDSSVDFQLRFWITDPEAGVANVESDVYLEVWKAFRDNGIEIPFPQRDLHIRSGLSVLPS